MQVTPRLSILSPYNSFRFLRMYRICAFCMSVLIEWPVGRKIIALRIVDGILKRSRCRGEIIDISMKLGGISSVFHNVRFHQYYVHAGCHAVDYSQIGKESGRIEYQACERLMLFVKRKLKLWSNAGALQIQTFLLQSGYLRTDLDISCLRPSSCFC